MYDVSKRREFQSCKVSDLVAVLQTVPQDAEVVCDGDNYFWIHIEADNPVVNIDSNSLDDMYGEES